MFVMKTRVPVNLTVIEIINAVILAERDASITFTCKYLHFESSECSVNFSYFVYYRSALWNLVKQNLSDNVFIGKLLIQKIYMYKRTNFFVRRRRCTCRW